MKELKAKVCAVCQAPFTPDRRVGESQLVCSKLSCQQERKRRAQKRWLANNPGYFKGRYPYVKSWLDAHPGYLKKYRARQKAVAPGANFDIQDEITSRKDYMLLALHNTLDIQDEISSKITISKRQIRQLASVIYKTSELYIFPDG